MRVRLPMHILRTMRNNGPADRRAFVLEPPRLAAPDVAALSV
jgi:hypothetical protein